MTRRALRREIERGTLNGLITRTLAVAVLCLSCGGCTLPALTGALQVAEYGTSTFNKGALETYYQNSLDEAVIAVRTMVNELGLRPISDSPKDDFLYLKVMDEAGQEIFIRVKRRARMLTSVSIRVGLLGDEPYSTALMREVTELLTPEAAVRPRPDRFSPGADEHFPAKPPEMQDPPPR
jgi:hypothetical protein